MTIIPVYTHTYGGYKPKISAKVGKRTKKCYKKFYSWNGHIQEVEVDNSVKGQRTSRILPKIK